MCPDLVMPGESSFEDALDAYLEQEHRAGLELAALIGLRPEMTAVDVWRVLTGEFWDFFEGDFHPKAVNVLGVLTRLCASADDPTAADLIGTFRKALEELVLASDGSAVKAGAGTGQQLRTVMTCLNVVAQQASSINSRVWNPGTQVVGSGAPDLLAFAYGDVVRASALLDQLMRRVGRYIDSLG